MNRLARRRGFLGTHVTIEGSALKVLARIMDGNPAPTIRELSRLIECSETAAFFLVRRLERLGLVTHDQGKSRTLRPTVRFIPAEDIP